jgi:hypothetical protein
MWKKLFELFAIEHKCNPPYNTIEVKTGHAKTLYVCKECDLHWGHK